jgi:TPR repeat protein
MKKKSGHRRRTKVVRKSRKNLRRTNKRKRLGKGRRRPTRRYSRIQRGGMTEEELEILKKNADAGVAKAQYSLGIIYENGLGVAKDATEAVKYYTLAGDSEHIGAIIKLADIYRYGRPGVEKNEDLAKRLDTLVNQLESAASKK